MIYVYPDYDFHELVIQLEIDWIKIIRVSVMEHLLKLALAYYKKSNYQQSLKYLDRLLNNPRNDVYSFDAEFWSLKEECHQALGEFNESDYCIDMGIEIDPSFYAEKATLCRSKG